MLATTLSSPHPVGRNTASDVLPPPPPPSESKEGTACAAFSWACANCSAAQ
jgi:hypothetical protein